MYVKVKGQFQLLCMPSILFETGLFCFFCALLPGLPLSFRESPPCLPFDLRSISITHQCYHTQPYVGSGDANSVLILFELPGDTEIILSGKRLIRRVINTYQQGRSSDTMAIGRQPDSMVELRIQVNMVE